MTQHNDIEATVTAYEFIERRPTPIDWAQFLAHRQEVDRLYRVDIINPDSVTLTEQLAALHADPLVLERCLDADAVSGVHNYDNLVALQLPLAQDWEASTHPKVTVLCFPNAVVTVRHTLPVNASELWRSSLTPPADRPLNIESLLFVLLDLIVDRGSELTLQARRAVDQLETDMQQLEDEEQTGRRLLKLKRAAAHFEMALEAKHRTLTALLSLDGTFMRLPQIREPLRDVVAHIEHSLRYIERMEDHLAELDRHFLLLLQDRANNRLRVLTIISAIFMPLMLIAGIYGMNFRYMPELYWKYAYGVVLLVMLVIAGGLLWFFHRRGWFR